MEKDLTNVLNEFHSCSDKTLLPLPLYLDGNSGEIILESLRPVDIKWILVK